MMPDEPKEQPQKPQPQPQPEKKKEVTSPPPLPKVIPPHRKVPDPMKKSWPLEE
jgi:hypothetical protein